MKTGHQKKWNVPITPGSPVGNVEINNTSNERTREGSLRSDPLENREDRSLLINQIEMINQSNDKSFER